jgi:soluble lytic murein transglycosylase
MRLKASLCAPRGVRFTAARAPVSRSALAALTALAVLTGCPKRQVPSVNAGRDAAQETDAAAAIATPTAASDGGESREESTLPWHEAIRKSRWVEAEAAIAALPEAERKKAEIRYARAKASLARGVPAEAIKHLENLEDELPLLRESIARARAQAALLVGPYDMAAEWFGSRPQPSAWITAAEAWEKAGELARARTLLDRAVSVDKKSGAHETRARTARMRVIKAKDGDAGAVSDARWLALNATEEATVRAASELLEKQSPPVVFTSEEWLARARVWAELGRPDDALRAVERAGNAGSAGGGKPATPTDLCHARAEAFYKARTRYPEAAHTYRTCAGLGGSRAAEALFLSARAFSRADRDGDALPAFAAVVQRYPKTTWAEQAEFHVARSHVLAGRWREGAKAFDDYVKHFPSGHDKKEADRYRAIAHFNVHDGKVARALLEELAGGSDDALTQARWQTMAAAAAFEDGDRTLAIGRWAEIARAKPLTFPALVSRARLAAAGATVPPTFEGQESNEASEPLSVELPSPVDVLHRIGLDLEAEDALREREQLVVAKAQGRGTEALCSAYGLLDRGKRRYQISLQIPAQLLAARPSARNRWAWDCAYPRPHQTAIHEQESKTSLPKNLLWAVMRQESAFDEEVVSPARAVGLLQLMPETARQVAKSKGLAHEEGWLVRGEHNIELGALYMKELLEKLSGNVVLATGAYNAGPDAINRWFSKAKGETIDAFVETVPFLETRGYMVRVMGNLARYGYLESGEAGVPSVSLEMR